MTAFRRPIVALCALSAVATAQDPPADQEERRAAVALERAAAADLELLHELTWGEEGTPELFQSPIGPLLNALHFSTDGRHLALQTNLPAWTFDLGEAAWRQLDTVDPEGILAGPAEAGGFLVLSAGAGYRVGPDLAEPELIADDLLERADLFAAPGGRRLVVSGLTPAREVHVGLVDLEGGTRDRLLPPERFAHVTAVAWSPDGTRLAVGWALYTSARRAPLGVRMYDLDGSVLRAWPAVEDDDIVRSIEFAFDARSLTVASGRLRRLDAQTGAVLAEADARPLHWSHVDPVVAVSVQADGITFWDAQRLRAARTIPIAEEPIVVRDQPKGPVLNAVLSPKGDLLAVGTVRGLRIYRVRS